MAPPPRRGAPGAGGSGVCSIGAIRLAMAMLGVVYCVFILQSSAHREPAPTHRSPIHFRQLNHTWGAGRQLSGPGGAGASASGGAMLGAAGAASPATGHSASAAASSSPSASCLMSGASAPIPITEVPGQAEDAPLAPGDRASEHVPALTVSFCKRYAIGNALITTAADQKYMVWARNWAKSLQAHGVTNLFLGAMDAEAQRLSLLEGIPAVLLGRMRAGTTWHSANRYKIRLVQGVVELGFDVLFTDADVTFVRDPLPFLQRYPAAGVLISTDLLIREKPYPMANGLENVYEVYGHYRADLNVGLMFVRSTEHTVRMMNHWADVANADMSKSMQTFFVKIVRDYSRCEPSKQHPELANCYNGTVNIGLLPMDLFAGGYIYFVERLPQKNNLDAISVHATYQVHQGLDGKRERLRHAHLWFLDDGEYYSPRGGLLSMAPMELPAWMHDEKLLARYGEGGDLRDAHKNRTLMHFELVHYQMRQLRQALAIAAMLGRTLIMPDFTVLLDNTWYPMNGAWPGFRKLGPFVAPLDHVLHMTQLKNNAVEYRSSTFLEHPCVKPSVTPNDVATVSFAPGAPAPGPTAAPKVTLPKGAKQVRAARAAARALARARAAARGGARPPRTRPRRGR